MSITSISNPAYHSSLSYYPKATDMLSSYLIPFMFKTASVLTDPVCLAHEAFRQIQVVNRTNIQKNAISKIAKQSFLLVKLLSCSFLAIPTAIPGVFFRYLAVKLQTKPYLYYTNNLPSKNLPLNRTFTLLSWNICCLGGGYCISNGGVAPWRERIDKIVQRILKPIESSNESADVVCLYEAFDASCAFYIKDKLLKNGYNHVYMNIGPVCMGVSSGMLIASKYKIKNPKLTNFPLDTLVGRTKGAAKAVFSFDLESQNRAFARVFATHMQHSEEPAFATKEEVNARDAQMKIILNETKKYDDRCSVITGDLNFDDDEYEKVHKKHCQDFIKDPIDASEKTWGGDDFCAKLVDQRVSKALNLDHTLINDPNKIAQISTSLIKTDYDDRVYKPEALSDHRGLFNRIIV